jgi:hypothetical protein
MATEVRRRLSSIIMPDEPPVLQYEFPNTLGELPASAREAKAYLFAGVIMACLPPFGLMLTLWAIHKAMAARGECGLEYRRGRSGATVSLIIGVLLGMVQLLITAFAFASFISLAVH